MFYKKYDITRINWFENGGDGYYNFKVSKPSHDFLVKCCTTELNTPNKVIDSLTASEIDILTTSGSNITGFEWVASMLGNITKQHALKSLKELIVYVDSDITIDLSGFNNLKTLKLCNIKYTYAPVDYINSDFPLISWGKVKLKELDIRGFNLNNFNLTKVKQLNELRKLCFFETKVSRISDITFSQANKLKQVIINGKHFNKTDMNYKLTV